MRGGSAQALLILWCQWMSSNSSGVVSKYLVFVGWWCLTVVHSHW